MSKEVASARIQHRGMTTQEWESSSDILMEREIGIDMTTGYPKVGDGKSRFSELNDLRGERGEKGDSITITKQLRVSDGVQITFSDETQVTIPKGEKGDSVKGDKGDSVESARVDESGNFYVTIEGQSEKLLGNIKGGKGDKGDALKFEDLTPDQIAQIKAKDIDLSAYATKAELAEIDVSKQLIGYLSKADADSRYATKDELKQVDVSDQLTDLLPKTEANSTYAKVSHKHTVSDITDLNLGQYATKAELKRIELTPGPRGATGSAGVGIINTTIRYAIGTTGTTVPRYGDWFTTPPDVPEGRFLWTEVVWKYSNKTTRTAYSVSKMGGQGPIGPQGQPGPAGRDAVLNVQVVSSVPSRQLPDVIYLVKG
ncbi:TPA: hypothetical protein TVB68_002120 [Streptococcus equi subsp. ruminatorum]|nr:hypothetical protein [Streptococcus equi subsp. ruminatorum]